MQVKSKINIDLVNKTNVPEIYATQGDSNTRKIEIMLFQNSVAWEVPVGVNAAIAFKKSNGHAGLYDELPDGAKAVTINGNAVTAVFAPQVLSTSGNVDASIVFRDSNLNQLATFPFKIIVTENPSSDGIVSNDYYKYSTMEEINAQFASLEAELFTTSTRLSQLDDSASIVCDAAGEQITLTDASNRALQGLKVYGKTEQFTTTGAQLIPYSYNATTTTDNGITFTDQGDHSYIVSGTATAAASTILGMPTLPAGTYTLSGSTSGTTVQINKRVDSVETALGVSKSGTSATFTISEETTTIVYIIVATGATVSGVVVKPILNSGSTALPFEPYTGGSHAPNPDYPQALESVGSSGSITVTVSGDTAQQTLTLSTPNGLPGIPVASGGNYTDENGQQWICDEVDFAKGVYVQRIAKVTIDGTQALGLAVSAVKRLLYYIPGASEATAVCSSSLQAGNWAAVLTKLNVVGATTDYIGLTPDWLQTMTTANEAALYLENHPIIVMYSLPALVETTLSTEEIAAYAALHTNHPNTTVYNDASAHMALRYVADTKAYIDNKFNELAAAIVNNT